MHVFPTGERKEEIRKPVQVIHNVVANGFVFQEYSSLALSECLRQACDAFRRPDVWRQLVAVGMGQDWSWSRSAKQYVELYRKTMERGGGLQIEN